METEVKDQDQNMSTSSKTQQSVNPNKSASTLEESKAMVEELVHKIKAHTGIVTVETIIIGKGNTIKVTVEMVELIFFSSTVM